MALNGFAFRFIEKEIELARGGVGIHLLVPSTLFAYTMPLHDTLEVYHHPAVTFTWANSTNGGLRHVPEQAVLYRPLAMEPRQPFRIPPHQLRRRLSRRPPQ